MPPAPEGRRSTTSPIRDVIVRGAVRTVRQEYVVCLDADSFPDLGFEYLAGAMRTHGLEVVSTELVPANPGRLLGKLQMVEYFLAMNLRRLIPWLVSGGCHAATTDAYHQVMEKHSMFFQGNDVEVGLLAERMGYTIGHVQFPVGTEVPDRVRPWYRQRYAWSGGEWRLAVANIKLFPEPPVLLLLRHGHHDRDVPGPVVRGGHGTVDPAGGLRDLPGADLDPAAQVVVLGVPDLPAVLVLQLTDHDAAGRHLVPDDVDPARQLGPDRHQPGAAGVPEDRAVLTHGVPRRAGNAGEKSRDWKLRGGRVGRGGRTMAGSMQWRIPRIRWAVWDVLTWVAAYYVALIAYWDFELPAGLDWRAVGLNALLVGLLQVIVGVALRLYQGRYRYGSYDEGRMIALVALTVLVLSSALDVVIGPPDTSVGLDIIATALAIAGMLGRRALWRGFVLRRSRRRDGEPTLILGAGSRGSDLAREMLADPKSRYRPVGFLDDDPARKRLTVTGVRVKGSCADLESVAVATQAEALVVAQGGLDAQG